MIKFSKSIKYTKSQLLFLSIIRIAQSLMLDEQKITLRQIEQNLQRIIWILEQSLMSTEFKFMIFKTIIKSKFFIMPQRPYANIAKIHCKIGGNVV